MERRAGHGAWWLWSVLATLHACASGASPAGTRGAPVAGARVADGASAGAPAPMPDSLIVRTAAPASAPARECARDRYQAAQKPLTIYTLFDESLSMALWWLPVTEAFSAFVRDPGPLRTGLQQLGALVGWHQASRLMIGIDPEWGTWFAYRALVVAAEHVPARLAA